MTVVVIVVQEIVFKIIFTNSSIQVRVAATLEGKCKSSIYQAHIERHTIIMQISSNKIYSMAQAVMLSQEEVIRK